MSEPTEHSGQDTPDAKSAAEDIQAAEGNKQVANDDRRRGEEEPRKNKAPSTPKHAESAHGARNQSRRAGGKRRRSAPSVQDWKAWDEVISAFQEFRGAKHMVRKRLTLDELYHRAFPDEKPFKFDTFKRLLGNNPPKLDATLMSHINDLKRGLRQAKAADHEDRKNYLWTARKLGRTEEQLRAGAEEYYGIYRSYRLSMNGQLVAGTLVLFEHPDSLIPYHRHRHSQIINEQKETFDYEGAVYMRERNFCLQSFCTERGSFRNTKMMQGNPSRSMLWGRMQMETVVTQELFDVHVIFIKREYLRDHRLDDETLIKMLRVGPLGSGRFLDDTRDF